MLPPCTGTRGGQVAGAENRISRSVHDPPNDPIAPLSEPEAYAEHRAALDATLFEVEAPLLLELRDGALFPRGQEG